MAELERVVVLTWGGPAAYGILGCLLAEMSTNKVKADGR